ncbi:MAG: hypothetical protein HY514_02865 [Candidatus Aenigmarchaeota archaeon]|nr:hypothetical protein [Candidatus Aenigmarchaeota archaeon]
MIEIYLIGEEGERQQAMQNATGFLPRPLNENMLNYLFSDKHRSVFLVLCRGVYRRGAYRMHLSPDVEVCSDADILDQYFYANGFNDVYFLENPREALSMLRDKKCRTDVIIASMAHSEINGPELAEEIRKWKNEGANAMKRKTQTRMRIQ